ncbi:pilus assembly protein TadG-related protein, partial [Castellaniella sp.]|uniref:pilus assembly protein TadG-related protein n=1 Tax=Castellaniella sp. TaxID=1955812 RepID=UPI00356A8BF4
MKAQIVTPIQQRGQRFARDERGAVAIIAILSFSAILGTSLFAIDMVRHNVAQTRLQSALDTAVISAGRKLADFDPNNPAQNQAWQDDAYGYFRANMPGGYLGMQLPRDALHIEYIEDKAPGSAIRTAQRVKMSVSSDLPLLSTGYFDQTAWPVAASNQARRKVRNDLELVLALDNSGSMDESAGSKMGTRMAVLKTSTRDLIQTVMDAAAAGAADHEDDGDEIRGAFIGLVPFNDVVNVGNVPTARNAWMADWLGRYPDQQNYIRYNWSGCIAEPAGNWSDSNRLPAEALTPLAGFQPLVSIYAKAYAAGDLGLGSNQRLVARADYPGTGVGFLAPSSASKDRRVTANFVPAATSNIQTRFTLEPQYCARSMVQFFVGALEEQQDKSLNAAVQSMQSYGGTNVGMGLLWAWRMLDPAWRGTDIGWGHAGLPRDYETDKLNKVIVLLSDGDNAPSGVVQRVSESYSNKFAGFNMAYAYEETSKQTCTTSGKKQTCSYKWDDPKKISLKTATKAIDLPSVSSF